MSIFNSSIGFGVYGDTKPCQPCPPGLVPNPDWLDRGYPVSVSGGLAYCAGQGHTLNPGYNFCISEEEKLIRQQIKDVRRKYQEAIKTFDRDISTKRCLENLCRPYLTPERQAKAHICMDGRRRECETKVEKDISNEGLKLYEKHRDKSVTSVWSSFTNILGGNSIPIDVKDIDDKAVNKVAQIAKLSPEIIRGWVSKALQDREKQRKKQIAALTTVISHGYGPSHHRPPVVRDIRRAIKLAIPTPAPEPKNNKTTKLLIAAAIGGILVYFVMSR